MNTVTASYTTADGRKLVTTFNSHATHLLAQYQAAERALKAAHPGEEIVFDHVYIRVH